MHGILAHGIFHGDTLGVLELIVFLSSSGVHRLTLIHTM